MKLSDYIAQFLVEQRVKHVFVVTGGCIVHVVDSVAKTGKITYIPVQHEQAGAMAADAYARITGNLGVALTTSGPGATNLLTGVCCAYYDSVPTLFITGQVPSSQLKQDTGSRQIGFQETDVVSIFQSVTKYAVLVSDPTRIRYELEKAAYLARSGRPGPVLVDVCDDVQRAQIDPDALESFSPPHEEPALGELQRQIDQALELMAQATRPVLILGWGVALAGTIDQAKQLVDRLGFPVAPTWGGMWYLPYDHPCMIGSFGVSSERAGNFAVQNSDLIIALGTRLDTHETGPRLNTFARGAKKIVVDIDQAELNKYARYGMQVDLPICADLRDVFRLLLPRIDGVQRQDLQGWFARIADWKQRYPICLPAYRAQQGSVNAYVFMDALAKEAADDEVVVTDAGGNLTWTMQAFRVKTNQRLFSAFNHSPMGYALPAAMGAALAAGKQVVCIIGDGGLQMNIQELSTIVHHRLPLKIFVINNHGYGIQRQTLDTWLESRYHAIDASSGVADPNYVKIAEAYGLRTESIGHHGELREKIRKVLDSQGPLLCNVEVAPDQKIEPKLVFGKPIEDLAPPLDREELRRNMLVEVLEK